MTASRTITLKERFVKDESLKTDLAPQSGIIVVMVEGARYAYLLILIPVVGNRTLNTA
jgi:hypothetical protein